MPIAPLPTAPHRTPRSPLRRLAALTALVVCVHWLLLDGMPEVLWTFQGTTPPMAFTTRTIEAPAPPPPPATPKPPPPKPQPPPATPKPASEPATPNLPVTEPSAAAAVAAEANATEGSPPGLTDPAAESASASAAAAALAASTPVAEGQAASPQAGAAPLAAPVEVAAKNYRFTFPEPVRLLYDVTGVVTFAYTGGAEMVWKHDGSQYAASLKITKFGFNLRNWTSKGALSPDGIAPTRFGDKGRSSEVAAHFQREKGIVSFSRNAPDVPLQGGAQDHLSAFFQLSGMLAAEPTRFTPGTLVPFQAINAQGSEAWVFEVGELENLQLPDGPGAGVRLVREHNAQYDTKVEVWLAPALSYLPARIRLSQTNGDFVELLWRSTQKPE